MDTSNATMRDILARLEAAEPQLAEYRAERAGPQPARRRGRSRRGRVLAVVAVALLLALVPLALLAANPFTDLNPGSVHNANIDAIYNAHITTGCVPDVSYCPNDFVTREQMASFLARTAGIGGNPPSPTPSPPSPPPAPPLRGTPPPSAATPPTAWCA